jgi:hypothetical protein
MSVCTINRITVSDVDFAAAEERRFHQVMNGNNVPDSNHQAYWHVCERNYRRGSDWRLD